MGTGYLPMALDQVFRGEWQQKEDDEKERAAKAAQQDSSFLPGRGDGIVRPLLSNVAPPNLQLPAQNNPPLTVGPPARPVQLASSAPLSGDVPRPSIANVAPVVDLTKSSDGVFRAPKPNCTRLAHSSSLE
jgi:hypothetical protein